MSSRGNSGPSVFRVFLFVLYTQTVSNSGGCLCCCWLFLPSTAAHPLYLQEGWAWLWLMPCHGEWYNHSSSRQNWNQLLYLYSHNWSWGEKSISVQQSRTMYSLFFFSLQTHSAQVLSMMTWDFPAKSFLLQEANPRGGSTLSAGKEPGHPLGWDELCQPWLWFIYVPKVSHKFSRHGGLLQYSRFSTRCGSLVSLMH